MTTIQEHITIQRPPEDVTAYVSDPAHLPEWNKSIARVLDVQTAPEVVGTTWRLVVQVLGREQEVTARVHLYDPPGRVGFALVGGTGIPAGLTAHLLFEAQPESAEQTAPATRLACTLALGLPLRVGGPALGAVITPLLREELRRSLVQLQAVLERNASRT